MATAALVVSLAALLMATMCAWKLSALARRGKVEPAGDLELRLPKGRAWAPDRPRSRVDILRWPLAALAEVRLVAWPSGPGLRSHASAALLAVIVVTAVVSLVSAFVGLAISR